MGKTKNSTQNTTNQVDARQLTENNTEIDIRNDFEDSSEGNIHATGDVTIQSEAVAISAIEQVSETQQEFADLQRDISRENAKTLQTALDANQEVTEQALEFNAQVSEQALDFGKDVSEKAIEETSRFAEFATDRVADLADDAIDEVAKANERATDAVVDVSTLAIETNENNFKETLDFLETEGASTRSLLKDTFQTATQQQKESNELAQFALGESFKSTVGGLADQQQKTLLYGLGMISALGIFISWRR